MEPICAAPSEVMKIVEQRAISLAARIGGRLTNSGKGGEEDEVAVAGHFLAVDFSRDFSGQGILQFPLIPSIITL